jgi:hypothetical protein
MLNQLTSHAILGDAINKAAAISDLNLVKSLTALLTGGVPANATPLAVAAPVVTDGAPVDNMDAIMAWMRTQGTHITKAALAGKFKLTPYLAGKVLTFLVEHNVLGEGQRRKGFPVVGASATAPAVKVDERSKGEKRPRAEIAKLRDRVVAFIVEHPGMRIEEINDKLGTVTSDLALPIRQALADKLIRTEGERRGTTYHGPKPKAAKKAAPKKAATTKKAAPSKKKAAKKAKPAAKSVETPAPAAA